MELRCTWLLRYVIWFEIFGTSVWLADKYTITSLRFWYIATVYGVIYVIMETLSEALNEIKCVHLHPITRLATVLSVHDSTEVFSEWDLRHSSGPPISGGPIRWCWRRADHCTQLVVWWICYWFWFHVLVFNLLLVLQSCQ